jgi:hypothetical protein
VALADLTEEEYIIGQAGLVAVRESMPLRPVRRQWCGWFY